MIHGGRHQSINDPFQEVTEVEMRKPIIHHRSFDALRTLYRFEDTEDQYWQRRKLSHEEDSEKR